MTVRLFYRTEDRSVDYHFSFEQQRDGSWLAFILRQPPYGRRNESLHHTHRLQDGDRRYYVCWTDPLLSLEDCKQVAKHWAEATQQYIRSGKRF